MASDKTTSSGGGSSSKERVADDDTSTTTTSAATPTPRSPPAGLDGLAAELLAAVTESLGNNTDKLSLSSTARCVAVIVC